MPDGDEPLSAMVILRPADPSVDPDEPITGANLARHTPAPGAVAELSSYFAGRGFEVGPFVGTSFAISAPARAFRRTFGEHRPTGEHGSLELDVRALPARLRGHLRAVSFSEPPDFGPGSP
ncbi:MAG: hypothetical protein ACR2HM_07425 [Acidimicrobiales bacterium]